jgi:hypothetical protein
VTSLEPGRLWPIERRVLQYLDQHGPTHRVRIVQDLSPDDSRVVVAGKKGVEARLLGAWTRRLRASGLVDIVCDRAGYYRHHIVTRAGRMLLRRPES